jgi:hypothetical protein
MRETSLLVEAREILQMQREQVTYNLLLLLPVRPLLQTVAMLQYVQFKVFVRMMLHST